jgi:hypothetical protein
MSMMFARRIRFSTAVFLSILLCVGVLFTTFQALANSPPGVVDIFVTTSAYSYVDTFNVQNPLTPNIGVVKTIYVNGRVTDGDGVGTGFSDGDLASVDLRFYRENAGSSCTPDPNDCYQAACTVTPNSETVLNYSCMVEVSYIADSTMAGGTHESEVWHAEVIVKDDFDQTGSSIKTFELETLLALDIPSLLDFGSLSREEQTTVSTNTEFVISQQGNDQADVSISGDDLTCSVNGLIPKADILWSLTDVGFGDPATTSLTSTPSNVGLNQGTDDDVGLSTSMYFNIKLPEVASGTCSGSTTISAVAI